MQIKANYLFVTNSGMPAAVLSVALACGFQQLSAWRLWFQTLLQRFAECLRLESADTDSHFSFFFRSSKPPQPVDSEAPSPTPSQPHAVPSPLICQLPQQELTDQSAESDPCPGPSAQWPGHHTRVRSASGQLGAKQQRATGDPVSPLSSLQSHSVSSYPWVTTQSHWVSQSSNWRDTPGINNETTLPPPCSLGNLTLGSRLTGISLFTCVSF